MWRHRWRIAAFALLFGSIFAVEVYRLFFVQHGTPEVRPVRGRTTLIGAISGDREVTQSFVLEADGLDRVTVRARPDDGEVAGVVLFELYEVVGGRGRLLYRMPHPAEEVVAGRSFDVRFPPVARSNGRRFRLHVRAPNVPPDRAVALLANLTEDYPAGRLFVDGEERWGDLVFDTSARRATLPWRLDGLMPLGPWWLRTWWLAGALFLAWNGLLAYACYLAVRPLDRRALDRRGRATPVDEREDPGRPRTSHLEPRTSNLTPHTSNLNVTRRRVAAAKASFALLLVALVALASLPPPAEEEVIDLLDRFPEARKDTELPRLDLAFTLTSATIHDERKRALQEVPPSAAAWTVRVPPGAAFVTDIAFAPHTWTLPSDGAIFIVEIVEEGMPIVLARLELAPYFVPGQRRWSPVRIGLERWAGRTVDLVLRTDPGIANNPVNDACLWGAPRIVAPRASRERRVQGAYRGALSN